MKNDFSIGDYVVYTDGFSFSYEIGRIKSFNDDKTMAFVAYHEGETGALTPLDKLYKLRNQHVITSLGGGFFNE